MSHTIINSTNTVLSTIAVPTPLLFFTIEILNYTQGGEMFSLATDFPSAKAVNGVVLGTVPPNQNYLGVPLFPIIKNGITLYQIVGGVLTEIPTTTALNATFSGIAWLS